MTIHFVMNPTSFLTIYVRNIQLFNQNFSIMQRIHIMLNTTNLEKSKSFYTSLLGQKPTKEKDDYVQWKMDEPSLNLSLMSKPNEKLGVNHLGIETDQQDELKQLFQQINDTDSVYEEGHTTCCYANSEKSWAHDPEGIEWEIFHTYGEHPTYYESETAEE